MKVSRARHLLLLCVALLGVLALAHVAVAASFPAGGRFDQEQSAREIALALSFMGPRMLDPEPAWQLALWGLRGLTTLDPRLTTSLVASGAATGPPAGLDLVITTPDGGRLLAALPAPAPDDPAGWGRAAASLLQAGWNGSTIVRRAGGPAVIHTFFDELFNHLDPYSRYVGPDDMQDLAGGMPAAPVQARLLAGMLVVRIGAFTETTAGDLAQAIARGLAGGTRRRVHGLVLDLRGNRGGLLEQAAEAADTLLDGGLIVRTIGRDPHADHTFVAAGPDQAPGLPVVVVADGRSASAAEILAAALADQHRAVVVGSATLGKGLVQTVLPLPDGGSLYLTWSRVVAPLGWPLQTLGVMPQVCTSLGEDFLYRQLAALSKGVQPLARALARSRDARAPIPTAEALEIRGACPAAEGRDLDLVAARYLIEHQAAYQTALLGPAR